ncbi:MAG: sialate O-acetylesterase, partial [Planctomycetota bacterium]
RDVDVEAAIKEKAEATGHYYRLMIDHVKHVLSDPGRVHPDYDPQAGFELAGFVWFQGWNDMVDSGTYSNRGEPGGYDQYSQVMAHFIRDVRRDLDAPDMHFVIGVLGVGGPVELYDESQRRYIGIHTNFRNAMAAPASMPEFEGNVTAVLTEECWDKELDDVAQRNGLIGRRAKELREANEGYPDVEGTISPEEQRELVEQFRQETLSERDLELLTGITNAEYHYRGSAKILGLIGKAFAEAMFEGMSE